MARVALVSGGSRLKGPQRVMWSTSREQTGEWSDSWAFGFVYLTPCAPKRYGARMMLTPDEEKALRKLIARVGVTVACRVLDVHRTSVSAALSGSGIRPQTVAVMRANLAKVKA